MASFIGYAPAEHPRFATLVVLDENNLQLRRRGRGAGVLRDHAVRAAAVRRAPDDVANKQYAAAQATAQAAGNPCAVPHGADLAARRGHRLQAARAAAQHSARPRRGRRRRRTGGRRPRRAATTAGSLPPDPSKHT